MTEINRNANPWMSVQFKRLLNTEHIRQHLIKVGLINRYGEVVPKEEYEHLHKRRSRRRQRRRASLKPTDDKATSIQRPSTAVNIRHPIEPIKSPKEHYRVTKSPDYHSINRQYKATTSISPTRQIIVSSTAFIASSFNTYKSIFVQRAVSPKIARTTNRCVVTMIYYGPQTYIDYDPNRYEFAGDEIIVMQQHCGGENLVVYRGAVKPNETFQFESRRHSDYPFALAFYVNGLIDNRLSVCCESRYKHNVRIGGKRGLFGIINVQRSQACRRCRVEQRRKRLEELKASRRRPTVYPISTPSPNITRSTTPEPSTTPKERSESPTFDEESKRNDLLKAYSSDVNGPKANSHSSLSNADGHELSTLKKQHRSQRSASFNSTERENSDQTNTNSRRTSKEIRRKDTSEE